MVALRTLCGAGNDHANYALGVAISLELNIPNFRIKVTLDGSFNILCKELREVLWIHGWGCEMKG